MIYLYYVITSWWWWYGPQSLLEEQELFTEPNPEPACSYSCHQFLYYPPICVLVLQVISSPESDIQLYNISHYVHSIPIYLSYPYCIIFCEMKELSCTLHTKDNNKRNVITYFGWYFCILRFVVDLEDCYWGNYLNE
jgi:hypothetical protein